MNAREIAAMCLLALVGCSDKAPKNAASAGSGGETIRPAKQLPKDDMLTIPSAAYLTSALAFRPDDGGKCTPAVLERVAKFAGQAPWPDDSIQVAEFLIDRAVASCSEFRTCIADGVCRDHEMVCEGGHASVQLEGAIAYCAWRGLTLPTLTQWQAAARGSKGRIDAGCEQAVDVNGDDGCTVTSPLGLVASFGPNALPEFTRTLACWSPGKSDADGVYPIAVFTMMDKLNYFAPLTQKNGRSQPGWFRCVKDRVAAR